MADLKDKGYIMAENVNIGQEVKNMSAIMGKQYGDGGDPKQEIVDPKPPEGADAAEVAKTEEKPKTAKKKTTKKSEDK